MKFDLKVRAHIDTKRPEKLRKALEETVEWGAKQIYRRARQLVPVRTGRLKRSIEIKSIAGGKSIGPDTDYDIYVEFGTGPHIIVPVRARALHWVDKSGKDVFAMRVKHPGARAKPYMRPAMDENRKPIGDHLKKAVGRVLK